MNRNNTTSNSPIGHTSSWSQIAQAHASQGHAPQRPLAVTGTEPSPPGRVGETTQTSLRSPESQSYVSNQAIRLEPGRASNLRAAIRRYVTLHLRPSIAQRHPLVKPLPTHLETHLNILRNLFNGRVLMGGTKRDMVMGLTSRANDTDLYLQTRALIEPDATTLESIKAEAFHRAEGSWQFKFRSDVLDPLIANASDEDIAAATKIATDKINNFITDKNRSEDFSKQIPANSTQREVRNALKTIIEARLEQQGLVKAFKEELIADYFDEAYCNWLEQAYRPIICQTLYDTTGADISPDLMGYMFGITAFKNVNTDRYIVQCTFGLGEDSVDIQITDRLPSRCYTCDGYLIDVFDETIVYLLDPNVVDAAIRDGMAEMGSQVRPTADKLLQLYKKTSRGKLSIDREVIMQYHDLISKSCYSKKAVDLLLNKLRRSSSEQSLQALYNIAQYDEHVQAQLSTAEKKVWRSIKRSIRRVCYETCQGNNIGHELINRIENSRSVITPLGNPIEDRESLITSEFKRDLDALILFKSFIEDSSLSLSTRRTHQGRILRLSTTITGNRYHCALPMSDQRECHKIMETVRLERSESLIHLASKLGCGDVLKYLTAQARSTHDMGGANEIWQTLPYLNRNTERFLVSLKDTDAKNRYKDLITDVVIENQTSYPYSASLYLTSSEQCLLHCLRRLDISTLHKVIQDTLFNAQPAVTSIREQTPEVEIAWNLLKPKIFSLYQTRLKEEGLELLSEYFDLEPTKIRDAFRNLGLLITIGAANSESGHYQQGRRDDEYVCTLSLQRVNFSYSIKTSNIDSYVANILSNPDKREQLKSLAKRLDLTELEPIFSDQYVWVRQDGTTDHSNEDKSTNKKQPYNLSRENKPVVTKKDQTTTLVPTVDTTRDAIISTDNGEPSKDALPSVSPTTMNGPATSLTESESHSAAQKIKTDKNESLLSQAATQDKNKTEEIDKEPTKKSAKKKKNKKKKKASTATQNTTQIPTLNRPNCVLQKDMFGITAGFTTPSGQNIEGKLSDYGDGDLETIYQKIIEDKSVALFDGKGTEYQIFVNRNNEFVLADDLSTDDEASALLPEITNPFILSPDGKITLDPNNHDHRSIIELIHEDGTAEFDGSLQSEDALFEGTISASPIEKKTKQRKGKKTKQQAPVDSPITVRMRPTNGNFSKINQPYPILVV